MTRLDPKILRESVRKTMLLCAVLTAAAAGAAQAEGLYIGGNLGGSHYKGDDPSGLATDRSDTGMKLFGGYSLTPNVSLEGGYADLGKFNGPLGDMKASGWFLDGVGTLPLGNNFSALGRVGVFNGKLDASNGGDDRSTRLKLGVGLEYAFAKNLALRGEWERYRFNAPGSTPDVDLYSVGLKYSF